VRRLLRSSAQADVAASLADAELAAAQDLDELALFTLRCISVSFRVAGLNGVSAIENVGPVAVGTP
jgi:hypothetical protein